MFLALFLAVDGDCCFLHFRVKECTRARERENNINKERERERDVKIREQTALVKRVQLITGRNWL